MVSNKFKPGTYLLTNTAILEIGIKDSRQYVINLVYCHPDVKLPLSSAGTVLDFRQFESIIFTYGKELIPVDPTKAEVVSLIYGTNS